MRLHSRREAHNWAASLLVVCASLLTEGIKRCESGNPTPRIYTHIKRDRTLTHHSRLEGLIIHQVRMQRRRSVAYLMIMTTHSSISIPHWPVNRSDRINPSLVSRDFKATWSSQRRSIPKVKVDQSAWTLLKNQRIRLRTQRTVICRVRNTHSEARSITIWPTIPRKFQTWIETVGIGRQLQGNVTHLLEIMIHLILRRSFIKSLSARLQVIKTTHSQARGKHASVTRALQSQD